MGNGTNYYLHRAVEPCPTCGRPRDEEKVHVGRSTYGWVFLWRGYRGEDAAVSGREIATPEQWWSYLQEQTAGGAVIKDEYGDPIALDELRHVVTLRTQNLRDGLPPRRHGDQPSEDVVTAGDSDVRFSAFS